MIDWKLFGKYIRNARINKKLSQDELGKKIGVASGTIMRIENKSTTVDIKYIISTCEKLEVNFADIVFLCKENETFVEERILKEKLLKHYKINYALDFDTSKVNWKSIKEALKKARIKNGWEVKQLGAYLKVTATRAGLIENKKCSLMLSTLKEVCEVLNINLDELLREHTIKDYKIYNSKDVE